MSPALPPVHAAQVERVGSAFLRRRPLVVAPLAAWVLTVVISSGVPRTQVFALAVGLGAGLLVFSAEALVARRRVVTVQWLFASLALTLVALSVASVATGGIGGPMVPMLFAPVGVGFAAFGAGPRGLALWGLLSIAALGLLAVPVGVPFPPLPADAHRLVSVGAATASVSLLLLGVGSLASAHAEASATAIAAAEEVVAASRARVRLVEELGGHFAHALKNPLAAIKALVEVMAEAPPDERTARRLLVVRDEVARMERLVSSGLDVTKPIAALERRPADVGALARRKVSVLEPLARQRGVRLEASGEPLVAAVDEERVSEALGNLLLNALEATASGGSVVLRWGREGGQVVLRVIDTGRGVGPDELARLGTPFFTTRAGGTGLGVALARQVAVLHGGALDFTSEPGRGTTARFALSAGGGA